jgi:hypothetical protein
VCASPQCFISMLGLLGGFAPLLPPVLCHDSLPAGGDVQVLWFQECGSSGGSPVSLATCSPLPLGWVPLRALPTWGQHGGRQLPAFIC